MNYVSERECLDAFEFDPNDKSEYVIVASTGHVLTVPLSAVDVECWRKMTRDCFSVFFTIKLPTK